MFIGLVRNAAFNGQRQVEEENFFNNYVDDIISTIYGDPDGCWKFANS